MKTEQQAKVVKRIPANCAETRLERNALIWLNDSEVYENGATGRFKDLEYGGCISGLVGHLIYSADCRSFVKRHKEDINKLMGEMIEEMGVKGPGDLMQRWDVTDPLGIDVNADQVAWFGFEEAARRVAQRAGIAT